MEAQQKIKNYIQPKGLMIVSMLLVIAALVLAILGMAAMNAGNGTAWEFYPSDSENGTMAYINVVGVSDWIYKYDGATYYSVEDAEGYLYTVQLTDSQYSQMQAQQVYWNRETEDAPMPAAYHLEGVVQAVSQEIRTDLAECWDVSVSDYDYYFGTKLLNATTTVSAEKSTPMFIFAVFCGIMGAVFLLIAFRTQRITKKCLQSLETRGMLERAGQQLENTECATLVGKNRAIMTQEFLFGKASGLVIPYSDILWCYKHVQRCYFIPVAASLMIGTAENGIVSAASVNGGDGKGVIDEAIAMIAQRNPNVMVGYTRENAKMFTAIIKAK